MSILLKLACETDLTERRRLNSNSDNNFQDDSATSHGSLAGNTIFINVTKSGSTNSMMAGVNAKRQLGLVEKILQSSSTRTDVEDHDLDVDISSYLN